MVAALGEVKSAEVVVVFLTEGAWSIVGDGARSALSAGKKVVVVFEPDTRRGGASQQVYEKEVEGLPPSISWVPWTRRGEFLPATLEQLMSAADLA